MKWNVGIEFWTEEYHQDLSDEHRLEYLALGDVDERNFRATFMNITNDRTNENNPGSVYKAIEWAIETISNLPDVERIQIGTDSKKKDDFLVNHKKRRLCIRIASPERVSISYFNFSLKYTVFFHSTYDFFIGLTGRKVQKIKEDIYNRVKFTRPAREKIISFLQTPDFNNFTVCTSIGKFF